MLKYRAIDPAKLEGAIICSVVPIVTMNIRPAVEQLTGKQAVVVGPGLKTGLRINIDNPGALGADRVADAVAAVNLYSVPLITIDMGTATTISVVDQNKNFIGGVIMPGLKISTDALASKTSQLPHISLDPPRKAIGRNTVDCMRSGIILGTASTVDGLLTRIEEELGESCTVISTGGLCKLVTPYCKHPVICDEQLLLKGLMVIYYKNSHL